MNDTETRAELERIDPFHVGVYLLYDALIKERVNPQQIITLKAFRLLAEHHKALREIAANKHRDDCQPDYGGCECAQKIAKTAIKEE